MATLAKSLGKNAGKLPSSSGPSVVGALAIGVGTGLAVALGRKVAVQSVSAMAGNWFEAIKLEHKMALAIFDKILATSDTAKIKRGALLTTLSHALAKHAFQEENVIYPALREAAQKDAADHLNHDHGYIKQYLYELEIMPKDSPEFLTKVREFRALVAGHATEEEEEIFPAFVATMSDAENKKLTVLMNKEGFKLA